MIPTICRCCGDSIHVVDDNPLDEREGNVNMCQRCVRLGVDLVPEKPSAEEVNKFPNGRWNADFRAAINKTKSVEERRALLSESDTALMRLMYPEGQP